MLEWVRLYGLGFGWCLEVLGQARLDVWSGAAERGLGIAWSADVEWFSERYGRCGVVFGGDRLR